MGLFAGVVQLIKPDPKRLLEFVVIAETGSITRAADKLNVSQPALSKSMLILEQSLGAKLMVRDRRGVELTECGKALISYARSVNSILARATEQITLMQKGMSGKLVVGVRPNSAVFLVPEVVKRLKENAPDISVAVIEDLDASLEAELLAGEMDIIVGPVSPSTRVAGIRNENLIEDPFVVLAHETHPIAGSKGVTLEQLSKVDWVMPQERSAILSQAQEMFNLAGTALPRPMLMTNSMHVLRAMVSAARCVAVVSRQVALFEARSGVFSLVPILSHMPPRHLGARFRADDELPIIANQFLACLRAVAAELDGDLE